MAFIKLRLDPINTRAADATFDFEEPYIQTGIISGQSYTSAQVAGGLPKPSYLQIAANSAVVTVVGTQTAPLRIVFPLGLHDANTGGEIGAWRSFTSKTVANNNVTVTTTNSAWVYAEINENGQPNNVNAWTIDFDSENSKDKIYTTSTTEPTSPGNGDLWFDVLNNKLYKYSTDDARFNQVKRVYLGEAGIGNNGFIYTIQSWFPNREYANYQDSFYEPYYENPWRLFDGVSFLTNGLYTAAEAANWANNATIAQSAAGNQIAMNAIANSATALDETKIAANSVNAFGNSAIALTSLGANSTFTDTYANSAFIAPLYANNSNAIITLANNVTWMNSIANSTTFMVEVANSTISTNHFANVSIAMTSIATSSVAMAPIANSASVMSLIANSTIAMSAIANSAIAQDAILSGTQNTVFLTTLANNTINLDILSEGSAGNILFTLIGTNSSYQTLVANAQGQLVSLANSVSGPILALGGNTVTQITDGGVDYRVHTFIGSGTLNIRSVGEQSNVEYLVIAGGGGGGENRAGGGGAGGYRTNVSGQLSGGSPGTAEPALAVAQSTSYAIVVGGGGPGALTPGTGTKGSNSSFGSLISTVGGGGGTSQQRNPNVTLQNGGSGGGGSSHDTEADSPGIGQGMSGGSGTPGQGFAGGNSVSPNIGGSAGIGGGGGGAGGAGANAINPQAPLGPYTFDAQISGNGGTGRTSPITGSSIMYAGGGGGGGTGPSGAAGGHPVVSGGGYGKVRGEGGNAAETFPAPTFPREGLANRGGGGGGTGTTTPNGNGGSGIVIVRYPIEKV